MTYNSLLLAPGLFCFWGPFWGGVREAPPLWLQEMIGLLPLNPESVCHRHVHHLPVRTADCLRAPSPMGHFPHWKQAPRGWKLSRLPLLVGDGAGTGSRALRKG